MATRTWTRETIDAFNAVRDNARRVHGLDPWNDIPADKKAEAIQVEKGRVLEDEVARLKTQAWEVGKHPVTALYSAPRDGYLVLPAALSDAAASSKTVVNEGDNLHLVVHRHYADKVDPKTHTVGKNFVSNDALRCPRSDFLGPDPCVVGFQLHDACDYHVEWFDRYLGLFWINDRRWKVQVKYDAVVEGWLVKDRSVRGDV